MVHARGFRAGGFMCAAVLCLHYPQAAVPLSAYAIAPIRTLFPAAGLRARRLCQVVMPVVRRPQPLPPHRSPTGATT